MFPFSKLKFVCHYYVSYSMLWKKWLIIFLVQLRLETWRALKNSGLSPEATFSLSLWLPYFPRAIITRLLLLNHEPFLDCCIVLTVTHRDVALVKCGVVKSEKFAKKNLEIQATIDKFVLPWISGKTWSKEVEEILRSSGKFLWKPSLTIL